MAVARCPHCGHELVIDVEVRRFHWGRPPHGKVEMTEEERRLIERERRREGLGADVGPKA